MVRLSGLAYLALAATQTIHAAAVPVANHALNVLGEYARSVPRSADIVSPDHTLERRKGGGGRSGGSSSSGSSSSSSGGGRSSSSSSSSSRTGASSYVGGSTRLGSGPSRSYGRGGYYGGGAAVPYQAGSRTPKGLIAGALIAPALVLAIMPGIWLYNVYPYHYNHSYNFNNRSATNNANTVRGLEIRQEATGANQTLPVVCLCQEFAVCGCDENDDQQYITDLIGNGSYDALNKTLVTVSDVNGTRTLVLNGSLPNGTTAPGGVDDAAASLAVGKYSGYWAMGLIVLYGVFM